MLGKTPEVFSLDKHIHSDMQLGEPLEINGSSLNQAYKIDQNSSPV